MLELAQDAECYLPGISGRRRIPGRVVDVADVGKGLGFGKPVAVTAECLQGLLKAGDGPSVLAEALMGRAQAVQGVSHSVTVAKLAESCQSLLAADDSFLIIAQERVVHADVDVRS